MKKGGMLKVLVLREAIEIWGYLPSLALILISNSSLCGIKEATFSVNLDGITHAIP